jgi:hypothetical protein
MKLDFGRILKRAFEITKNNRSLWLFGILIAFFNVGSNVSSNFSRFQPERTVDKLPTIPKIDPSALVATIIIVILAVLVITLIVVFIGFFARAALIDLADKADKGESATIKSGFKGGFTFVLPLFAISIVIGLPLIIVLLLAGVLLLGPGILLLIAKKTVIGIILLILGGLVWLALLIAGSIAVTILNLFADRYLVLDDFGIFESIKRAFALFKGNLGTSLLLWLINIGIGLVQGAIVLIVAAILGLPIVLLAMAVSYWLFILLIFPFTAMVFTGGLFETFFSTFWTLAYKELVS